MSGEKSPDRMTREELELEVLNLRALLKDQLSRAPGGDADEIEMAAGIALRTGDPFVHFRAGDFGMQFTVEGAREQGRNFIELAEEAEKESEFWGFMTEKLEMDRRQAAATIEGLRRYRKERQSAQSAN